VPDTTANQLAVTYFNQVHSMNLIKDINAT